MVDCNVSGAVSSGKAQDTLTCFRTAYQPQFLKIRGGENLFSPGDHIPYVDDSRINGELLDSIDLTTLVLSLEATAVTYQTQSGINIPTIILINFKHRNLPFSKKPQTNNGSDSTIKFE
jgi:hypothetical protein